MHTLFPRGFLYDFLFFIGSPTGVNHANLYKLVKVVILGLLLLSYIVSASADEQEDLAKKSQNLIGNIISLPFENNFIPVIYKLQL